MVYPMIINKEVNSAFLMFMIILIIINISVELSGYCSNLTGIIFGIITGGFIGIIYYLLLESSGHGELAYMTQFNTNNIQCGKAGTQKFRCTKKK